MKRNTRFSLHSRIFLMCSLLLVGALFSGCIFVSIPTMNLLKSHYTENCMRDLELISTNTQTTLKHLYDCAISIASDSRVIEAVRDYPEGPQNEYDAIKLRKTIGNEILSITATNSSISNYDLFTCDGKGFGITGTNFAHRINEFNQNLISLVSITVEPKIYGPVLFRNFNNEVPVFLVTKSILNLDTHKVYGVLVLVVQADSFSTIISKNNVKSEMSGYIINENQTILSAADKQVIGQNITQPLGLNDWPFEAGVYKAYLHDAKHDDLIMYSKVDNRHTDWRIVVVCSLEPYHIAWLNILKTILIIAVCACFILLHISYILSQSITKPIHDLSNEIQFAADNQVLTPLSLPGGGKEFQILLDSFNTLLLRLQQLVNHINEEQKEQSNIRLQLIQSQVKPHFLYNTLMIIQSLVDLDMKETASECLFAMSSFYRLSLNNGNDILKLKDEMELSNQYMCIQKLRYVEQFDYNYDVPDTLLDCYLPKMTIQPILENAIYHGIRKFPHKGEIRLTGFDFGDTMEFQVFDNGCGMNRETLEQLCQSISGKADHPNTSFGLYSVNRRIQLLYGKKYGIRIDSVEGQFTQVTLCLPKYYEYVVGSDV